MRLVTRKSQQQQQQHSGGGDGGGDDGSWMTSKWMGVVVVVISVVWVAVFWSLLRTTDLFTPTHLQFAGGPLATSADVLKQPEHLSTYLWGSYRPQVYFGLKTRQAQPLTFGMMWLRSGRRVDQLRHTCEQGDGLRKYGWQKHDGESFGEQLLYDQGSKSLQVFF